MKRVSLVCLGALWACGGDDPRPATPEEAALSLDGESFANIWNSALHVEAAPGTAEVRVCGGGQIEVAVDRIEETEQEVVEVGGVVHFRDCELLAGAGAVLSGELDAVFVPPDRGWRGEGVVDVRVGGAHYQLFEFVQVFDEQDIGFYCKRATVDLGDGEGRVVVGTADCAL